MNEDTLNMEVRKFLKQVGVTSQRELEHAIVKAIETGELKGTETLQVKMTLELPGVRLTHTIEDQIKLE
ncbi:MULTISPECIES: DUF6494 family protein [Methylotuvimicrobium]|uniref:Uncharacterized protein n=2 Tax=Methylotuvimicrobium TaxID=2822410 RepID=G4SYX7_META2|nr:MULTISPECIES: DUF6494 family protein [Methylotuvimicrobium]QCW84365.1 hypothetical protein EQU24_20605 [Methylotuvimicrobium buryatense]CCE25434.1 conserved protein of unknown function [Methylotuvimicrobium alcaliphilum 20Z]